MTSIRKIVSNRSNAARSCGPRSAAGKGSASRNALRHGLAVSISNDPAMSAEAERLAKVIAGVNASSARLAQARIIADAELDLLRIRHAQVMWMNSKLEPVIASGIHAQDAAMSRLADSNSGARSNSVLENIELPAQSFAASMLNVLPQLIRLDRYERRAISRRRRAMRAFSTTFEE